MGYIIMLEYEWQIVHTLYIKLHRYQNRINYYYVYEVKIVKSNLLYESFERSIHSIKNISLDVFI